MQERAALNRSGRGSRKEKTCIRQASSTADIAALPGAGPGSAALNIFDLRFCMRLWFEIVVCMLTSVLRLMPAAGLTVRRSVRGIG